MDSLSIVVYRSCINGLPELLSLLCCPPFFHCCSLQYCLCFPQFLFRHFQNKQRRENWATRNVSRLSQECWRFRWSTRQTCSKFCSCPTTLLWWAIFSMLPESELPGGASLSDYTLLWPDLLMCSIVDNLLKNKVKIDSLDRVSNAVANSFRHK